MPILGFQLPLIVRQRALHAALRTVFGSKRTRLQCFRHHVKSRADQCIDVGDPLEDAMLARAAPDALREPL